MYQHFWRGHACVSHKLSLKKKLLAKHKLKAPLPPSVVVPDPAIIAGDPPLAEPSSPSASPRVSD